MTAETSFLPNPVALVLNARGGLGRLIAFALALLAVVLPAVVVQSPMGLLGSFALTTIVGWSILFPPLIAAATVAPAIPTMAPFTWLIHIAAVIIGGASFIFVWKETGNASLMRAAEAAGFGGGFGDLYGGLGGYIEMGLGGYLGMGIGGYGLLLASTVMLAAPLIPRLHIRGRS